MSGPLSHAVKRFTKIQKSIAELLHLAASATRRIIVPHATYQILDLFRMSKFKGGGKCPPPGLPDKNIPAFHIISQKHKFHTTCKGTHSLVVPRGCRVKETVRVLGLHGRIHSKGSCNTLKVAVWKHHGSQAKLKVPCHLDRPRGRLVPCMQRRWPAPT